MLLCCFNTSLIFVQRLKISKPYSSTAALGSYNFQKDTIIYTKNGKDLIEVSVNFSYLIVAGVLSNLHSPVPYLSLQFFIATG